MLGIETSCDDTGVAIVTSEGEILGEALASQAALHEEWGGVVPGIARDAHAEALDRVVAQALERAPPVSPTGSAPAARESSARQARAGPRRSSEETSMPCAEAPWA